MGSSAIIGCPRAILSRNQTREIFFSYFTGGDSAASCTVTIHLPRSKMPAPIDPLPIHHAAPLISIPGSLLVEYRMDCAIDRILTSSFVNCRRGTWPMLSWPKTVTLIGRFEREGEYLFDFSREIWSNTKNNSEAMISSSTKVTFIFLYVSIEKKSKSLMNYSFKFRTLKYSRLIFDERETQIRLTIRTNIFSFWYSITIGSTRSSTVLN